MAIHEPVLLKEVIEILNPQPGEFFIDGTYGGGGHAQKIRERIGSEGRLLTLDWNENTNAEIHDNFAHLPQILEERQLPQAHGLLLDLGYSSEELENSGRGFSFGKNEPLLMTYSNVEKPVYKILQDFSQKELAEVIRKFSGERFAGRIAKAIKSREENSVIATSLDLAQTVLRAVPGKYERGRLHPATRTFQALRIYANRELENLEVVLGSIEKILRKGGRAAVITFHSLEDRIVKKHFRRLIPVNPKPIRPSAAEIRKNRRARSARLRAALIP